MKQSVESLLGRGVYGIPEAARYTGLHHQRVRSWFKSRSKGGGGPIFRGDLPAVQNNYAISFLDLIDVLIAGQLRNHGVSMHVVRAANELLKDELSTEHPFCRSELLTDGRDIFMRTADELGNASLSEVLTKQSVFPRIILPYLERIDYGQVSKLAERWRIAEGVVIDPAISLGKPVVAATGTTTFVLANAYFANGRDSEFVADLFNLDTYAVSNAVSFEEKYGVRRAA